MSIFEGQASSKGGGEQTEIPSADSHAGVLVAMIDLGTQRNTFKGEDNGTARKMRLVWELTDECLSGTNRHHIIGIDVTMSCHKKAKIRQWAEKLRGKEYAEGESINYEKMLGCKALVSVVHKDSANGERTYANIDGLTKPIKGMQFGQPQHAPFCWEIGKGPIPADDWIPWVYGNEVKDLVESSPEWKALHGNVPAQQKQTDNGQQPQGNQAQQQQYQQADEIPF